MNAVIKPLFNADPDDPRPTFGSMIKSARLGFHWSEPLKAMVRIDAEGPPWKVTMCPPNKIPNGGKGAFLVWWGWLKTRWRFRGLSTLRPTRAMWWCFQLTSKERKPDGKH